MNHTIVAMVGDRIVRVQCNTCGSTHNHHPVNKAKAPSRAAAVRTSSAAARNAPRPAAIDADRQEWSAFSQGVDMTLVRPYAMDGSFRVNDPVRHPTFGLGVVKKVAEGKAEILFEGGRKLLKCG
jgi:hypothetical protein